MKKLINILLACLMVVALAFGAIACDQTGGKPKDPGVYASKINGVFTLTQYVDDGTTTVVDLGALVTAKYGVELGRVKAGAFDGNKTVIIKQRIDVLQKAQVTANDRHLHFASSDSRVLHGRLPPSCFN